MKDENAADLQRRVAEIGEAYGKQEPRSDSPPTPFSKTTDSPIRRLPRVVQRTLFCLAPDNDELCLRKKSTITQSSKIILT